MQPYTPEQREDVKARTESFVKDYSELTKKHQIDFMGIPQYIPVSGSCFGTNISLQPIDLKYLPKESTPSPFKLQ